MKENIIKRQARRYGEFVARRPFTSLAVVLLLLLLGLAGAASLTFEASDNRDAIPQDIEVLQAFELVNSKFPGGTQSMRVAIELNSRSPDFGVTDIREPEALGYAGLLAKRLELIGDVRSASTLTSVIELANDGRIPQSLQGVKSLINEKGIDTSRFVSPDLSVVLISLSLEEGFSSADLFYEVQDAINDMRERKPGYVDSYQSGDPAIRVALNSLIGPDMGRTTAVSMLAIFIIMLILFMSLRKTIIALLAVVFGLIWAFGIAGFTGLGFNQILSAAASMILGIGIDFGIQMTARFKQEFSEVEDIIKAMGSTLSGVFIPLATTTAVGVIGFTAMTLGQLTILADLGTMMIYGIVASFLAAFLAVPPLLAINQRLTLKLKSRTRRKK
jgi:uncharacterized protein